MSNFTLGEKIRRIRKGLKLNQLDFAKRLGFKSATAISKFEDNSRTPGKDKLIKIAEMGNISLDELLVGEKSFKYETPKGNNESILSEESQVYNEQPKGDQIDKIKISEDLILTTQILESNTPYATALHLNIRSFARAVEAEERITLLETNQLEFEKKMTAEIGKLRAEVNRLKATYEGNDGDGGQLVNGDSGK